MLCQELSPNHALLYACSRASTQSKYVFMASSSIASGIYQACPQTMVVFLHVFEVPTSFGSHTMGGGISVSGDGVGISQELCAALLWLPTDLHSWVHVLLWICMPGSMSHMG